MSDEPEADAISLAMFVDSLRACSDPTKRRAADVIERLLGGATRERELCKAVASLIGLFDPYGRGRVNEPESECANVIARAEELLK